MTIGVLIIIIGSILIIMGIEGSLGKNVMRDTQNIRSDAEIVSITPKQYGTKGNTHYEAVIKFSDGSWYRTHCGIEKPGLGYVRYRFDETKVPIAVQNAKQAHDKVVKAKEKRKQFISKIKKVIRK